jgi:hypothetical protein
MRSDAQVAKHYSRGRLEETIFRALEQAGLDLETLRPADLAALEEFHVGGIVSTQELGAPQFALARRRQQPWRSRPLPHLPQDRCL